MAAISSVVKGTDFRLQSAFLKRTLYGESIACAAIVGRIVTAQCRTRSSFLLGSWLEGEHRFP